MVLKLGYKASAEQFDARRLLDCAVLAEQVAHGGDVHQLRHVDQRQRFVGEQRGGHQRKRGILRAADDDLAVERHAAQNLYGIHVKRS